MTTYRLAVLLAVSLWLPALAAAQHGSDRTAETGRPFIRTFAPQDYGAAAQNWDVVQDAHGVMYFGNNIGVLQYDGAHWRLLSLPNRSAVRRLAVAEDRIYVGGYDAFGYLAPDTTGSLQYVSLRRHLPDDLPPITDVWSIVPTPEGVYFLTRTLLLRWSEADGLRYWTAPYSLRRAAHFRGRLLVQTREAGLHWFRGEAFEPALGGETLRERAVADLLPLDDRLVVVTENEGLFTYDGATVTPLVSEADRLLRTHHPYRGTVLPDGRLAIPTLHGGVLLLDRFGRHLGTLNATNGLPSTDVKTAYADRAGGLWLGLQDGIARVELASPFTSFDAELGLDGHVFEVVRFEGILYAATSRGVFRLQRTSVPGRAARFVPVRHLLEMCQALLPTEAGLLAGCDSGVYVVTGDEARRVMRLPEFAVALHRSRRDPTRAYVGLNSGVAVLQIQNGRWTGLGRLGGVHEQVRTLLEDGDDLWLGTNHEGLVRVKLPLDGLRPQAIERFATWRNDRVNVFHVAERPLFSATTPALVRYVGGPEPFTPDAVLDSVLAGDRANVFRLAQGHNGDLWVRAGGRHAVLRHTDGSYRWEETPLQRLPEGSTYAIFPEPDGTVWFGGTYGLVRFSEAVPLTSPTTRPRVRRLTPVGTDSVLFGGTSPAPPLVLPQNALRFTYAAPLFEAQERVRYQIRLDGFDRGWSEWTNETQKDYTNLPPGHYQFRVRARDAYDRVSAEDSLAFVILPPWYRTPWAYGSYGALGLLLLGGTGWGIGRWRSAQLQARNQALEHLVAERTEEVERQRQRLAAQNARLEQQAEQLRSLDEAKSRFFANISHEFRTPLTLIAGPTQSLLDGRYGPLSEDAKLQHELILRNTRRLRRLIDQVLALARIETGHMRLETRIGDLGAFVTATARAFVPMAERLGLRLTYTTGGQPLPAAFDPDQFERVLANLLSNALKFTPDGGHVVVTVREVEGTAEIAVADTGPGIPADRLPYVFDRFYQADTSTTRPHEGTGIGLALAKELVELHGGSLTAESTLGAGSTFTVRLPLANKPPAGDPWNPSERVPPRGTDEPAAAAPAEPAETPASDEPADRTTILVIDDTPDIRDYVRSLLEPSYRVLEAADGQTGLRTAREALPDLIIADVMMPAMDGLALSRTLKTEPMLAAVPVVLLTARAGTEAELEGIETGADDYVTKPFEPAVLVARVDNLIAQRRRLRERYLAEARTVLDASGDGSAAAAHAEPAPSAFERQVCAAIHARLAEPDLSVEILAGDVALSRSQLYRRVRDETGLSPVALIRRERIREASRLLAEGAGNVSEVGYAVGFQSLSHFARHFREHFGVNPSEYLAATKA